MGEIDDGRLAQVRCPQRDTRGEQRDPATGSRCFTASVHPGHVTSLPCEGAARSGGYCTSVLSGFPFSATKTTRAFDGVVPTFLPSWIFPGSIAKASPSPTSATC